MRVADRANHTVFWASCKLHTDSVLSSVLQTLYFCPYSTLSVINYTSEYSDDVLLKRLFLLRP